MRWLFSADAAGMASRIVLRINAESAWNGLLTIDTDAKPGPGKNQTLGRSGEIGKPKAPLPCFTITALTESWGLWWVSAQRNSCGWETNTKRERRLLTMTQQPVTTVPARLLF